MRIDVEKVSDNDKKLTFKVRVEDDKSETKHKVTLKKDFYNSLKTKTTPDKVIVKSFQFLLEREPKEMILPEFNINDISKYFQEFDGFVKKF